MRTKPIFRLYKIEIKLISHSIWNYYDTKYSFLKNLEFLKEQNIVPKIGEGKSHGKIVATAKKGNVTYVKYEDGFVAPQ